MTKERLQKKRYKRAIKKAKCYIKIRSIIKSIYFLFIGKNTIKGIKKNVKNVFSGTPYYTIKAIRCDDYEHCEH